MLSRNGFPEFLANLVEDERMSSELFSFRFCHISDILYNRLVVMQTTTPNLVRSEKTTLKIAITWLPHWPVDEII